VPSIAGDDEALMAFDAVVLVGEASGQHHFYFKGKGRGGAGGSVPWAQGELWLE
jgi:hypothetical protein